MCVSNNAIELHAYHFFEKIQESYAYNIVRVDFIDGTFLECDHEKSLRAEVQGIENLPLIKNLILQTKAGEQYSVEPDELGLQFANGELSYRQYLLVKKHQSRKMLGYTFGFTVLFITMAWTFISYFYRYYSYSGFVIFGIFIELDFWDSLKDEINRGLNIWHFIFP